MAKLNEIRFFLLVSLMIIPTRALIVSLANDKGNYKHHIQIGFTETNGAKAYRPGSHPKYIIDNRARKVILYIVSTKRFTKIMQDDYRDQRMELTKVQLADTFFALFFMAIDGFKENEDESVIRQFLRYTIIKSDSNALLRFYTIGDTDLKETFITAYLSQVTQFTQYEEFHAVLDGQLGHLLKAIARKPLLDRLIKPSKK